MVICMFLHYKISQICFADSLAVSTKEQPIHQREPGSLQGKHHDTVNIKGEEVSSDVF